MPLRGREETSAQKAHHFPPLSPFRARNELCPFHSISGNYAFSPASTSAPSMFQPRLRTLFLASAVLASSAIHHIGPRQRDDVAYLYSSIEMAREGTTFETNLDDWESAVEARNMTDWDNLLGFDITKPYLDRDQSRVSQFPMRLNIVSDYPLPADGDTRFTTITSVSISAPPEIKAGNNTGTPRSIDPSWNLCFGYFYFDHDLDPVEDLGDSGEPCAGYLSDGEECVDDIEAWLAEEFQANNGCPFQDDPASAKLPESCEKVTSSELVMFRSKYLHGSA